MRGVWWLLALCMVPTAQAQLTIDDPVGDVYAYNVGSVPPPQPLGIDLVQGSFQFDEAGVHVTVRVDDMESIDNGSPWVGTSTEYRATWKQEGFREGSWMLRVVYTGDWSNMAEGPCIDGADADGCAGEDRDIHDDVPMQVNVSEETVSVLVPYDILPRTNVTWSDFSFATIAAQSVYPVFFSDAAFDQTGFQVAWPTLDEGGPAAGSTSTGNRTGEPAGTGGSMTEAGSGQGRDEGPADNGTAGPDVPRETPSIPLVGLLCLVVIGTAVARRPR